MPTHQFFFFSRWVRNQELDVLHELFAGHSPSVSLGLFSVSAFVPGSLAFWFLVGSGGWQALMGNQKVGGERGQGINSYPTPWAPFCQVMTFTTPFPDIKCCYVVILLPASAPSGMGK